MSKSLAGGQSWRWREAPHLPSQRKKSTLFVVGGGEDPFLGRVAPVEIDTMFNAFRSNIRSHRFLLVVDRVSPTLRAAAGRMLPKNVVLCARVQSQSDIDSVLRPTLRIPAAHHAVVIDPLVSPIDLPADVFRASGESAAIQWVMVSHSAKRAVGRALRTDYLLNVIHDCAESKVPLWVANVGQCIRDHAAPCSVCGDDELAHEPGQAEPFADDQESKDHEYAADNLIRMCDSEGADMNEWPEAIRVRQRPNWMNSK